MLSDLILDRDSVRILDFLLDVPDKRDFSKAEIHRFTRIPFKKMDMIMAPILACEMIHPSRKVGRAQLYSLDEKNPVFKSLMRVDLSMCKFLSVKELDGK